MSYLKLTLTLVSFVWATGSVRALDLCVVTRTYIQFFSNGTAYNIVTNDQLNRMNAAAYDPIRKDVYVSDSYGKFGSIFRIKTTGKTVYNVIVARQDWPVNGIAFDHLNSTLYWTTNSGIFYVHVPDSEIMVPLTGQVFFKLKKGEVPHGITIDVRRGFLYWENSKTQITTIERSRLDGSGRRVMVQDLADPRSITVDVMRNTLYWIEMYNNFSSSIDSMDLCGNGTRQHTLVHATMEWSPYVIALDNQNMYWINWEWGQLCMMPKNLSHHNVSPTPVFEMKLTDYPIGLFVLSGDDS